MNKKIVIGNLFPELLNLYGDIGNIDILSMRCKWRGIEVELHNYSPGEKININNLDIIFLGGGSDREQEICCNYLRKIKKEIFYYIENEGVFLSICGGYQLLGEYYETKNKKIKGLGILDMKTIYGRNRLIGNIIIKSNIFSRNINIVGFENHMGKTYHKYNPLGKVVYGYGNNGEDKNEGIIYKNFFGSYLHGPLLSKNPELSDFILFKILNRKYGIKNIISLDDYFEKKAKETVLNRYIRI